MLRCILLLFMLEIEEIFRTSLLQVHQPTHVILDISMHDHCLFLPDCIQQNQLRPLDVTTW